MPPKRVRPTGDSPPTKKTKDKDKDASESDTLCITCDKLINDNGLLCEFCFRWEHNLCAGISNEAYSVLGDSSPNLMFFCTSCRSTVTVALKFFNDMKDKQNALEAKITKLENDICKHNSIEKRLEELESKIINNNEKVEHPHETSVPSATSRKQTVLPKPASTLDKKFNIVIYGLTEPPVYTNKQGHTRHDLDCLMRLFS